MHYKKLIQLYRLTLSLIGLIIALPLSAQTSTKTIPCCGVTDAHHAFTQQREELRNIQNSQTIAIPNDNILRVYRLAIPIDYDFFINIFNGDMNRAKEHWNMLEQELNRIYQRDFGVAFTLVRDEKLIRNTRDKATFSYIKSSATISSLGTTKLNEIIGSNSYDLAIWLADFNDNRGIASLSGGFNQTQKGSATTTTDHLGTTAHEIAHLLGASHTGTTGTLPPSRYAEPNEGTSLMSYGFHQTKAEDLFFSLVTIQQVRKNLANCGYYNDTERSSLTPSKDGYTDYNNYPVGVKSSIMRSPAFHLEQAKKTYRITRGTALRFTFPAYNDAKDYVYAIHQNDIAYSAANANAQLVAQTWKNGPAIHLMHPEYERFRGDYTEYHTTQMTGLPVGSYKILLGAVENLGSNDAKSYKRSLDAVEAQLEVIDGTPFRITSSLQGHSLKAGENITLTWSIDKNIYTEQERLRIWLSDDYGKTYKYLVADDVANDGEHTFKVPERSVGAERGIKNKPQGQGIFLIEVKGHIACATTDYRPSGTMSQGGGFTIESTTNSLQPYVYSYLERGASPNQPQPEQPKTYEVTLTTNQGGSISITESIDLNAVTHGRELTVKVEPQSGYRLSSLKANGQDITERKTFVVTGVTNVEAVFVPIEAPKYNVTLEHNEGGSISIENVDLNAVTLNSQLEVKVVESEGYKLTSLKANDEDITATKRFVVRAATKVVAVFTRIEAPKPKTYSLTLRYDASQGELSSDQNHPNAVPEGTVIKVTAKAKEGYVLKSLKAGTTDILATGSFVIQADTEVVAIFEPKPIQPPVQPSNPGDSKEETTTEEKTKDEIKVYPTVFSSTLWVSGYEQIKRMVMYDLLGRRVQSWDTAESQLNLGELMPNTYILVLYPKDGSKHLNFKLQKR